jgi:hypothetical protein
VLSLSILHQADVRRRESRGLLRKQRRIAECGERGNVKVFPLPFEHTKRRRPD